MTAGSEFIGVAQAQGLRPCAPPGRARRCARRRGTLYVAVFGAAVVVTVIGLSALTAVRLQTRTAEGTRDLADARFYAQSAVELALLKIQQDADWRTTYPNGRWFSNLPIGGGKMSCDGVDPIDGDLADYHGDPLVLTGIGEKGAARYKLQVTLNAELTPLESLKCALHVAGDARVNLLKSITLTGGPLSSNATVTNLGTINGNVEGLAVVGTVNGTVTLLSTGKANPSAEVIPMYAALGTAIAPAGVIDRLLLGPGANPWGAPNADGVYVVTTSSDLLIRNSRIHGTLVVRAPGRTVTLDNELLMHNHRSDYPVLIVQGNLLIRHNSTTRLQEATAGVNFNPPGCPYGGVSDSDTSDEYPSEVQGLVHVTGRVTIENSARLRGTVLCESTDLTNAAEFNGTNEIIYNPALYTNPPVGYTSAGPMIVSTGSWKQATD